MSNDLSTICKYIITDLEKTKKLLVNIDQKSVLKFIKNILSAYEDLFKMIYISPSKSPSKSSSPKITSPSSPSPKITSPIIPLPSSPSPKSPSPIIPLPIIPSPSISLPKIYTTLRFLIRDEEPTTYKDGRPFMGKTISNGDTLIYPSGQIIKDRGQEFVLVQDLEQPNAIGYILYKHLEDSGSKETHGRTIFKIKGTKTYNLILDLKNNELRGFEVNYKNKLVYPINTIEYKNSKSYSSTGYKLVQKIDDPNTFGYINVNKLLDFNIIDISPKSPSPLITSPKSPSTSISSAEISLSLKFKSTKTKTILTFLRFDADPYMNPTLNGFPFKGKTISNSDTLIYPNGQKIDYDNKQFVLVQDYDNPDIIGYILCEHLTNKFERESGRTIYRIKDNNTYSLKLDLKNNNLIGYQVNSKNRLVYPYGLISTITDYSKPPKRVDYVIVQKIDDPNVFGFIKLKDLEQFDENKMKSKYLKYKMKYLQLKQKSGL